MLVGCWWDLFFLKYVFFKRDKILISLIIVNVFYVMTLEKDLPALSWKNRFKTGLTGFDY